MAATGFCWFLGNFADAGVAAVDWLGAHALYLYRGPLVHLLVTYPSGRLSSRLDRAAVAVGYAAAFVTPVWQSEIATIVLAVLLVAVCAAPTFGQSVPPGGRACSRLWAAGGLGLVVAGGAAARLAAPAGVRERAVAPRARGDALRRRRRAARWASLTLVGAGGRHRPRRRARREPVGDAAGRARPCARRPDPRGRLLAPGRGCVRRFRGSSAPPSRPRLRASVTVVEGEGRPVAALVHDPAVLDDPAPPRGGLVGRRARGREREAAGRGARPGGRATSIAAADPGGGRRGTQTPRAAAPRGRRAAAGAACRATSREQPLRAAATPARERIERTETQLERTLEEFRRLAHGLHPRVPRRGGAPGRARVACRAGAGAGRGGGPGRSSRRSVEAVAYFVCSEALANIAKHASASRASRFP